MPRRRRRVLLVVLSLLAALLPARALAAMKQELERLLKPPAVNAKIEGGLNQ